MTADLFNAELEAQRGLLDLYEQAKKCQQLFERANIALPEVLRRVLGMNGAGTKQTAAPFIAPPEKPSLPPQAESDWIWIRSEDAAPSSIVLAVLRAAAAPVRPKDVIARVNAVLPMVLRGTVSNVGTRLKGKMIELTDKGWKLIDPQTAGIVHKGYFWGPQAIFGKSELAAQRRDALLHVLAAFDSGLQIVQIVEQLKRCSWVVAPINKDLVKEDIAVLSEKNKIRRRGNSKKWELAPVQENGS